MNLRGESTVEIRIFKGANLKSTVLKNLEFCKALVKYTQPGQASLAGLHNPVDFLGFVCKRKHEYRFLHRFLQKHGWTQKGAFLVSA